MKKNILILTALSFLAFSGIQAKELQALFYHASFFNPTDGPYVETYLKVFGPSAEYIKTSRGTYQASLEVTLIFKKEEKIADFRKYNLLSGEIADTSKELPNFIDQQRILLPAGVYEIELHLKDNNSPQNPVDHGEILAMEYDGKEVKFSDFQFVESYKSTQSENILSKSGYDLVPLVGDFFPAESKSLTFYLELYNLDKKLGAQQDFLFRYYLESFETNVALGDFAKFQRQKASLVNPIIGTMVITDLPSGNYNLVVEARDRNNELITMNKIFFQRSNPGMQLNLKDIQSVDITATFAERITSIDSMKFYVLSVVPVATSLETQFARNVANTNDIGSMQKFLYNFWKVRNELNPEAEWNKYREQVMAIEASYKTKIKHGFETDMGRVWLKYGTPNQVEESKHEPTSYPYVIWHYYHLDASQNNKRFIFSNPHLVGTEYFLIHSDARGEIYNPYWQYELQSRVSSLRNYDTKDVDGGWGSRASELFKR